MKANTVEQRAANSVKCLLAGLLLTMLSSELPAQPEALTPDQELSRLMVSTFVTEKSDIAEDESNSKIQDRRIALSSDNLPGTWLYYQLETGVENKLYRQRVIKLTSIDENTVVQELYTPKDMAAWQDAWNKPEVVSSASLEDFDVSLNKGCEQVWTRVASKPPSDPQWRGYVDPEKCKIFSKRRSKEILIEGESVLSLELIKHAERGFSVDRQQIWGSAPDEFNTLIRQHKSSSSIVEFSKLADWRKPDPANLVVMKLDRGDVWIELAPQFAPRHVENLRILINEKYFDGSSVVRSQDNYVAQWGDAKANTDNAKKLGKAKQNLELEFFRDAKETPKFTALDSRDAYAERVGLVDGFPVAGDSEKLWLTHCYGMLGVGRDIKRDSGNASSLYVVTGHAPRHLDRNVTLIGRVLSGIQHLSSLPRGTGSLGFYTDASQHAAVKSMRLGSSFVSSNERQLAIEVMRTDTETFQDYVSLRTNREEDWFLEPTGRIGLCNVAVPTRGIGN